MNIFITEDDMCTTQKLNLARVHKWFEANGCIVVDNVQEADRIIVATCNGWKLLEENSYQRIKELKARHSDTIVLGCVVDAHPEKVGELFDGPTVQTKSKRALSFGGIEKIFPQFEMGLDQIPAQSEFRKRSDYRDYNPKRKFVNIAEGCSFACSFCTHKPGLGPRRSRTLSDIMSQIDEAIADEAEVVHLMGMETALWGIDLKSSYTELLKSVLNAGGGFEVHVAQFQPHGLKLYRQELAEELSNKRVVDIQIPIQSTSDRIMKMMNRKNHAGEISQYLKFIKQRNTRATLRTDVIVGWPTETFEERMASLDYAGEHFDEIAVYGIELSPDLPAWKYQEDAVSPEELENIVAESKSYLEKYGVMTHSGQQDDATMEEVEQRRIALRELKSWSSEGSVPL